jgi:hypothetical protein
MDRLGNAVDIVLGGVRPHWEAEDRSWSRSVTGNEPSPSCMWA